MRRGPPVVRPELGLNTRLWQREPPLHNCSISIGTSPLAWLTILKQALESECVSPQGPVEVMPIDEVSIEQNLLCIAGGVHFQHAKTVWQPFNFE